jgi:hypothetical protein
MIYEGAQCVAKKFNFKLDLMLNPTLNPKKARESQQIPNICIIYFTAIREIADKKTWSSRGLGATTGRC